MSYTLKLILKHLNKEPPSEGHIDFPFDVESFCLENDKERFTREVDNNIIISLNQTKIKELEDKVHNLEDRPLEKAIEIGFYRTVAALRKKECDHRGRFVNTDYSDYLLENMKEILK